MPASGSEDGDAPRMADLPRSEQLLMKQARERKVHDMARKLAAEFAEDLGWPSRNRRAVASKVSRAPC